MVSFTSAKLSDSSNGLVLKIGVFVAETLEMLSSIKKVMLVFSKFIVFHLKWELKYDCETSAINMVTLIKSNLFTAFISLRLNYSDQLFFFL